MGRIKRPHPDQPSLFDPKPSASFKALVKEVVERQASAGAPVSEAALEVASLDPKSCPRCRSMGSIMSVTSPFVDGAPSMNIFELVTTFECEEGHRWEIKKERRDVCAHGLTTDCACVPCGRSWEDVADAASAKAKDGTSEELIRRGKVSRRIRP